MCSENMQEWAGGLMMKKRSKIRRTARFAASLLLALLVAVAVLSCGALNCGPEADHARLDPADYAGDGMTVTLLDVGQGLCVLIESEGHYMIYDGGGRDSSSYVVSYLEKQGCTKLDYMIASHYDADHIAGLVGCLNKYPVDCVICPTYEGDTRTYRSFAGKLQELTEQKKTRRTDPRAGDSYEMGQVQFDILSARSYEGGDDNDCSIVVRVGYRDFHVLLTGDAAWRTENEILSTEQEVASDILVVGHHGSSSSSGWNFVNAVKPSAALISCGEGNEYGHPTDRTLRNLEDCGTAIYRTDLQGEILCTTDGKGYFMNVEPIVRDKH